MPSINKVPDQGYIEAVLAAMDRYPFATQSLILLVALGAFVYWQSKRKPWTVHQRDHTLDDDVQFYSMQNVTMEQYD